MVSDRSARAKTNSFSAGLLKSPALKISLQSEPAVKAGCYLSVVYKSTWYMKSYTKIFQVNPLGRDLVILITLGMLIAGSLVTAGLILINQF